MSNRLDIFPVPPDDGLTPDVQPFDSITLANHLGIRHKSLWSAVLVEDSVKYKLITIPKKSGKVRLIHAPSPGLKFIQRRLNKYLNQFQEHLPDYVSAYRPSHKISDAVQRHIAACPICDSASETPPKHNCPRKGAYLQMDLKDFFHHTRRWWVGQMLEKDLGLPNSVAGPIRDIVTVKNIPCPTKKYPEALRYGVPQGAPTSGAICNLVAYYRMDKPICEYLEALNLRYNLTGERAWVYSRYADDLAFTCGRDFPFHEKVQIVNELIEVIEKTGYAVNKRKVHIRSSHRRKDLLGLNFNDRITISRDEYLRLRALVHNCLVHGIETQYQTAGYSDPERFISWLKGKLSYVQQVDPRKGGALQTELAGALANYAI